MKNLPLAGFRPFVAFLLLIAFLFGCQKDNFSSAGDHFATNNFAFSANFPATVEEAMALFSRLNLKSSNLLSGDSAYAFLNINPLWEGAFVGHSQSGREIVVVPLADSSIRVLNNGRADAKLVFTKIGADTMSAQILVYAADSLYFASNTNALNFNTFTGAFAFFDLAFNFQYGVFVEAGQPVTLLDSININAQSGGTLSREVNCWTAVDIYVLCDPPVVVFTNNLSGNCYTSMWIGPTICDDSGGGGGGGGGTGGGGSGGGGSGNSGGGSGGGGSVTPPNYWDVLLGQIPVEIFVQNGGSLPEGFNMQLFKQFIDIYKYSNTWTPQQLQWIANHPDVVPVIWNAWFGQQAGEEALMVKPVLMLATNNNLDLTGAQFDFLIRNPTVFQAIKSFLESHPNDVNAAKVIQTIFTLAENNNLTSTQIINVLTWVTSLGLTTSQMDSLLNNLRPVLAASDEPKLDLATNLSCFDLQSNSNATHKVSFVLTSQSKALMLHGTWTGMTPKISWTLVMPL